MAGNLISLCFIFFFLLCDRKKKPVLSFSHCQASGNSYSTAWHCICQQEETSSPSPDGNSGPV